MDKFDKIELDIIYNIVKGYLEKRRDEGLEIGDIEYQIFGKLVCLKIAKE